MLRSLTTTVEDYDQIRDRTKRAAVAVLRQLVDAVPKLGDVSTFLSADRRAQDAMITLTAMSFSPMLIAVFVGRERFTDETSLRILAGYCTRSIINVIKEVP
jgi:hypothetical protein